MRSVHYFVVQLDQPKCRLIEKNSYFYNFVIFNRRSMKLGAHVLYEELNQTISIFFAQPTKSVSYRYLKKKTKKCSNFWMPWNINLNFCLRLYYIHLLFSDKFFWNQMMQTSPASLPADNLLRWITSTKIVPFGWNLVWKIVIAPAHHYCPPLPPWPTITAPAHPFCRWLQYFSDFLSSYLYAQPVHWSFPTSISLSQVFLDRCQ